MRLGALALGLALSSGCAHFSYRTCDPPEAPVAARLPARLSQTGLYRGPIIADGGPERLAPELFAFTPAFQLWSDGASKRRWIHLPQGTRIDGRDPDGWRFPTGTKLWKEFSLAGRRVETRLLQKVGPGDGEWAAVAYLWRADGSDADAVPEGRVLAPSGYLVPDASQCWGCHGGVRSRVLGFSAIQLAAAADPAPGGGAREIDLAGLVRLGLLGDPPAGAPLIPGDAVTRSALGYLHANCGHCHNQDRPPASGARCFDPRKRLDLALRSDRLATPQATGLYTSTRERGLVVPGAPDESRLLRRMVQDGVFLSRMPPLGAVHLDQEGLNIVRAWIASR